MSYKRKSDEDLKEIALGILQGTIYTSDQVGPGKCERLGLIFLPMLFISEEVRQEMIEDEISFIYAHKSDAIGTRGINGQPMFSVCGTMNKEDTERLHALTERLHTAIEGALKPEE